MRIVEDIDVIKLKKELEDNTSFRRFIVRPSTISNALSAVSFQTMSCLSDNLVMDAMFLLLGGYNVARIINNWKIYNDIDYKLCKRLERTEAFRRMCENYFTFVHEVAKFAKQFDLKSSKEVLLFFEMMMKNGYFSETHNHEYRKFNYVHPEMSGTVGAQVTTGSCVCRHMSAIFCDLLYQMNISGCNVIVKINYEDEIKKFLRIGNKKEFNHAVVGIVEDGVKFIYDPTHATFAGKCESKFRGCSKDDVAFGVINDKIGYYFTAKSSMSLNRLHMDSLRAYNKASMEEIDFLEVEKLRLEIMKMYLCNMDMFKDFYFEYINLLHDIAYDVKQLMPKTDEELEEWVIKY